MYYFAISIFLLGMENQRPVLIGGYDVGFVDKHSSDIESRCPICLLILKDPYYPINCKCGTHFCMTCIDWVYKTKGPSCPMCKEHFEGIAANLELKRALENKEVYCTYKLGGCTWKGALRNLDSHLMDNCCMYFIFLLGMWLCLEKRKCNLSSLP